MITVIIITAFTTIAIFERWEAAMARISRERAQANREQLLDVAGRLFRERGIDGVGVAELSKAAGMTHGALYSRFCSKDEVAAAAFAKGQEQSESRMNAALAGTPSLNQIFAFYVSSRQRDNLASCCPMLASASEAARQSDALREQFGSAFRSLSGTIEAAVDAESVESSSQTSRVMAGAMIGVGAVARAIQSSDPQASNDLLAAAPAILAAMGKDHR